MSGAEEFLPSLAARRDDMLEACTACGKCVEVCPMPDPAGIGAADPAAVAAGVIEIVRSGAGPEASVRWADACTGSGHCIPACPEAVNPRLLLALARQAKRRAHAAPAEIRTDAGRRFGGMSRGLSVLARLQLPPATLARLGVLGDDAAADEPSPEVVFYTGCNVLKTPHIALLCLDVMDALGVRYRVSGGPSQCCGVLQFQASDLEKFGAMSYRTIDRFAATGAREVLAWCPSCMVHLGEAALETRSRDRAPPFGMTPFVRYLAGRLDELRPLMTRPVAKRVGLHEHPGVPGVAEAARRILEAVPGLEFVDLAQPRVGYMCNTLNPLPEFKRDVHAELLAAAAAAGVDAVAGVYHACHRELCSHERDWPFEVVNFMELVGESMGLARPDLFKRLKIMQDADAIVAESAGLIETYGLDRETVRAVVLRDMIGEQPLPLTGAP